MKDNFYNLSAEQVAEKLKVDPTRGLNDTEIHTRQAQYGLNILEQKNKISPIKLFLGQFKDFLILILLAAAIVSIFVAIAHGESWTEGLLILFIVISVAIVGFLNEYKAERTIEALKKLIALKAKILSNGEVIEVDAKDLVPGDVLVLEEGQKVPADVRLTQAMMLQINESSLTGESQPVYKNIDPIKGEVPLGDRINMVFSGTSVTSGKGFGIVVGTGSSTEIGKIATLVDEAEDEETPMQKKLDKLGKQLGYGVIFICALVFIAIFFFNSETANMDLARRLTFAFIAAVALAVAAIPEGLAFVVRISLALGARRMAARNALIRRLPAVEALGSTDTICSDKTGTLTKGEMTVRQIWSGGTTYSVTGTGYGTSGDFEVDGKRVTDLKDIQRILELGATCNNAKLTDTGILGDPTEAALIVSAKKAKLAAASGIRVMEVPFSSDRKRMSIVYKSESGFSVASKGAAEAVLGLCDSMLKNGKVVKLTAKDRQEILAENDRMASEALRVLGFAYKETKVEPKMEKEIESKLVFVGLQGMMDPPRIEVQATIQSITKNSGLTVIMITGDHIETAKAVAREIGIEGEAISGAEIDKLSQEEFDAKVDSIRVYARVSPEHKIKIVQALKRAGHQVAMTGDGVNDAPAIKAADIGIAMGITGTDVAKEAADVILLDDHFNTIINAIEEGRGIYDNVRKFVAYLISANIAEVFIVTLAILLFGKLPLTAVQILFINIVTDGMPAVALGSDPAEKNIMNRSPRRFQENILNKRLWIELTIFGAVMSMFVLIQFSANLKAHGLEHAMAVAFTATVVMELVRLINLRSDYKISWLSNPWLIVAVISSLLVQLAVVYITPLANTFKAGGVTLNDWIYILTTSVLLFFIMKFARIVLDRIFDNPAAEVAAQPAPLKA